MNDSKKKRVEFGDFQTPDELAIKVTQRLRDIGISPSVVVEPTCGVGAFVVAAAKTFSSAKVMGFEVNDSYLGKLRSRLADEALLERVSLLHVDFFGMKWESVVKELPQPFLVLGNFPWVTSSTQGAIGGANLPDKSNFQNHNGFDAISGKANFDISEWMLLEVLKWFSGKSGDIAMLVKTAVARKVLAHAERQRLGVRNAFIIGIDAKKDFNASVDACLLVIRMTDSSADVSYDYAVSPNLDSDFCTRVGHRDGLTVGDLDAYEAAKYLSGDSPQKWRSGVKHDASSVMEFTRTEKGLVNGFGEVVDVDSEYIYPLLKGSDIGSANEWRSKYVLVTQKYVGESTDIIRTNYPKTWCYLENHSGQLDGRGSTIYKNNPRFSIFGVGPYAFKPWRIAICGLYKRLRFRLVGPIENKPVMFDDTVYFISFDSESDAQLVLDRLNSEDARKFLLSLIFWDEKRPIKTSILNNLDWDKLGGASIAQHSLPLDLEV